MVKNSKNIIVGISAGDLNGVGVEVILKTFADARMFELCTPVLYANAKIISYLRKGLDILIPIHGIDKLDQVLPDKFNVLNTWREGVDLEYGKNDEKVGRYAIKSFTAATKALKEGQIDVLVTAPINKYNIQSDEFSFPGHTDYLNRELNGNALMLMVYNDLRVGLLTDHIPVNEVSKQLSEDLLRKKIASIKTALVQDFGISKPRIAVLGLNPHSGDNGVIGKEEENLIKPTLKKIFEEGTLVFGPYSSDSLFGSKQHEKFDAVLAMYHDQGLIPFKTLSFGKGVNYTAGLDKIRTSPDHGTGYEIAGTGTANHESFREAVYTALDIYRQRKEYQSLTKDVLKPSKTDYKKEY